MEMPATALCRWVSGAGLGAAVALAYFVVAYLSLNGLFFVKSEGVAAFWPAAGISLGVLIGFEPRARWPVAAGVMLAVTLVTRFTMQDRDLWIALAYGLCDTIEPLIIAGLIALYFGRDFALDRLRNIIGLLVATMAGCLVSSFAAAVASRLFLGPSAPMLYLVALVCRRRCRCCYRCSAFVWTLRCNPGAAATKRAGRRCHRTFSSRGNDRR
jgi:hypothetical protein